MGRAHSCETSCTVTKNPRATHSVSSGVIDICRVALCGLCAPKRSAPLKYAINIKLSTYSEIRCRGYPGKFGYATRDTHAHRSSETSIGEFAREFGDIPTTATQPRTRSRLQTTVFFSSRWFLVVGRRALQQQGRAVKVVRGWSHFRVVRAFALQALHDPVAAIEMQ